jgi:hypothetical protein
MGLAVVLALAASFCTATASVCQRLGARTLERGRVREPGFHLLLVFRLARQPVWLLGFAAMVAGFVFQAGALRLGPLALVQPILAVELLFVFGYLAVSGGPGAGVRWRDWLAAAALSAPSGGRTHAPAPSWCLAGAAILAVVAVAVALAGRPRRARATAWRAACLGIAAGTAWGYVAAVIKELSAHVGGGPFFSGPGAIFTTWSVYVLMAVGAGAMLLTAHAMAAGPLAASQPGFTICDPVAAIGLGVFLFGEQLRATPLALTAQVAGLIVAAIGAWLLSRSDLITGASERG